MLDVYLLIGSSKNMSVQFSAEVEAFIRTYVKDLEEGAAAVLPVQAYLGLAASLIGANCYVKLQKNWVFLLS